MPSAVSSWLSSSWFVTRPDPSSKPVPRRSGFLADRLSGDVWGLAAARRRRPLATGDIVSVCESVIDALRRLDDEEGGSLAALALAESQLDTVLTYLIKGRAATPSVRQRLIVAGAQLNQLSGWLAFETQQDGLGRRYFRAALAAAREAGDPGLIAYVLSYMSHQEALTGEASDAERLAAVGAQVARRAHPTVQALLAARVAQAAAAEGDVRCFEAASARVRTLFEQGEKEGGQPGYMYWFDSTMVSTVQGESGLLLAGRAAHHRLLSRTDAWLRPEVSAEVSGRSRNVMLYSAWLAELYLQRGDLDRASSLAEVAVEQSELVRSGRALARFNRLKYALLRHRKLGWHRLRHLRHRLRIRGWRAHV